LSRNIEANGLANVSLINAACGPVEGEVELFARGRGACNTLYRADNYGSSFRPMGRAKMVTLDGVFRDFSIERCDLLKLDCEGAEYEIVYSAPKEKLERIKRITMEYHCGMNQHKPDQLAEYLRQAGFEVDLHPPLDEEGGYMFATRR